MSKSSWDVDNIVEEQFTEKSTTFKFFSALINKIININ